MFFFIHKKKLITFISSIYLAQNLVYVLLGEYVTPIGTYVIAI